MSEFFNLDNEMEYRQFVREVQSTIDNSMESMNWVTLANFSEKNNLGNGEQMFWVSDPEWAYAIFMDEVEDHDAAAEND